MATPLFKRTCTTQRDSRLAFAGFNHVLHCIVARAPRNIRATTYKSLLIESNPILALLCSANSSFTAQLECPFLLGMGRVPGRCAGDSGPLQGQTSLWSPVWKHFTNVTAYTSKRSCSPRTELPRRGQGRGVFSRYHRELSLTPHAPLGNERSCATITAPKAAFPLPKTEWAQHARGDRWQRPYTDKVGSSPCSFVIKIGLQGFYLGGKSPTTTGSLVIGNETKWLPLPLCWQLNSSNA